MQIGEFIRESRKAQGLTQKDLSDELGKYGIEYHVSTIGWWETGRTNPPLHDPTFVNTLSQILHISPDELFRSAGYNVSVDGPRNERESRLLAAYRRGDIKELMRIALEESQG